MRSRITRAGKTLVPLPQPEIDVHQETDGSTMMSSITQRSYSVDVQGARTTQMTSTGPSKCITRSRNI